jgi:hypothetical protein
MFYAPTSEDASYGTGGQHPLSCYRKTKLSGVAGGWTEITITLAELGNPAAISRLSFQSSSASAISTVSFDHIRLEPPPALFEDGFESGDTSRWSVAAS